MPSVDTNEVLETWMDSINFVGPACSLAQLRDLLDAAPQEITETGEYQFVRGFYLGRLMHEELPTS